LQLGLNHSLPKLSLLLIVLWTYRPNNSSLIKLESRERPPLLLHVKHPIGGQQTTTINLPRTTGTLDLDELHLLPDDLGLNDPLNQRNEI
jgi:hypothetical protein